MTRFLNVARVLGLVFSVALVVVACAGGNPNFTVNPGYAGSERVRQQNQQGQTVAVRVTDLRRDVKPRKQGEGEILAKGDIGTVFTAEPVPQALQASLEKAFQDAGFTVRADAPVMVDVQLQRLALDASQFTSSTLNSESGSTLDAVRILVPKATRPTSAEAELAVTIRKHDRRLGYAYTVNEEAANEGKDRAIVEKTLDTLLTRIGEEVVLKAAPDIAEVARLPVSDNELRQLEQTIDREKAELDAIRQEMAKRQQDLARERETVAALRRDLEADGRHQQAELAKQREALLSERESLVQQVQAQQQQQAELQRKLADIEQASQKLREQEQAAVGTQQQTTAETQALAEKLAQQRRELDAQREQVTRQQAKLTSEQAQIQQRQAQLQDQQRTIEAQTQQLAQQAAQIGDREARLAAQIERLSKQEEERQIREAEVGARAKQLTEKEAALAKWEKDLKEKENVGRPPEVITRDAPPTIIVSDPLQTPKNTTLASVQFAGTILDDAQVVDTRFLVNGQPIKSGRKFRVRGEAEFTSEGTRTKGTPGGGPFSFNVPLQMGQNTIVVAAWDSRGQKTEQVVQVMRTVAPPKGQTHVVAIGVNSYANVPQLKFARADAEGVAQVLQKSLNVPASNVQVLADDAASLENLRRALNRDLKSRVSPDDTVVIFFSGHGAPEPDREAPDGFERYLLPPAADPKDLYATALPMSEVARLISFLDTERVVFMLDTCYSGGVNRVPGGRGVQTADTRAFRVRSAVDPRLAQSGRVILTASEENQVSQEKDELGHGVFSYYVCKALSGEADANKDRMVTVDELYKYVNAEVSKATAGAQTPTLNPEEGAGGIVLAYLQ